VEVVGVKRWFLPATPDLLGTLTRQGEVTEAGMGALCRWADGDRKAEAEVRSREHEADRVRRELLEELRRAFVTPIGPEDVYELSERLDNVLNAAKDLVRETDVLGMHPDPPMAEMARLVAAGVGELVAAFPLLDSDPDGATSRADAAVRHERALERVYRRSMSALLEHKEVREVGARRELYRRCARMGEQVEHVAHRIWYAVVKEE
jgi:uncharacterized protein Yka (UPF0111/DUF47 family)